MRRLIFHVSHINVLYAPVKWRNGRVFLHASCDHMRCTYVRFIFLYIYTKKHQPVANKYQIEQGKERRTVCDKRGSK